MNAIEIAGISKTYRTGFLHLRRSVAVADVSLAIRQGEAYGLLGPNGAGKTTTFSLLFGFSRPDRGTIQVLGSSPRSTSWRARAGYLPEQAFLPDFLTPREALDLVGALSGVHGRGLESAREAWLDRIELSAHANRRIGTLSKGMKQRLSLAMSLLHDPELIVLDEPMSGLDPLGRALVRDVILEQRRRGRTIVFSTHILSDAEALCDRVGLIAHGRMIDEGAFADVFRREARSFEVLVQPPDGFAGLPDLDPVPDSSLRRAVASVGNLGPAIASLERAGASIVSVSPIRDSLDASFARKVEQAASR